MRKRKRVEMVIDNIIKEDYKELIVVLVFEVIKGVLLLLRLWGYLEKILIYLNWRFIKRK